MAASLAPGRYQTLDAVFYNVGLPRQTISTPRGRPTHAPALPEHEQFMAAVLKTPGAPYDTPGDLGVQSSQSQHRQHHQQLEEPQFLAAVYLHAFDPASYGHRYHLVASIRTPSGGGEMLVPYERLEPSDREAAVAIAADYLSQQGIAANVKPTFY